jgi:hypothetical protein
MNLYASITVKVSLVSTLNMNLMEDYGIHLWV